jgi:hypothetical protein
MKTQLLSLLFILAISSCGTKKPEGLTEVANPFGGNRYETNSTWFRATGSGESINMETSRDKARLMARQRLAADIQSRIKRVSEEYKGERQADHVTAEFNERFQSLTRDVSNQVLVEVQTIDEKTYKSKTNNYVTYIAIESRKKTVYNKLKELASIQRNLTQEEKDYISRMIDAQLKELKDDK